MKLLAKKCTSNYSSGEPGTSLLGVVHGTYLYSDFDYLNIRSIVINLPIKRLVVVAILFFSK